MQEIVVLNKKIGLKTKMIKTIDLPKKFLF